MRKELNIYEPKVKTYLRQGFPTSIVGNKDWLYEKYVNMFYCDADPNNLYVNYLDYDFYKEDGVFHKGYHLFPNCKKKELVKEMQGALDTGWYYFGKWNELFVPGTYYHKMGIPYEHANLIYGYDDIKKYFLVEGYLADWKWHRYLISYKTFLKATVVNLDDMIEFETYKVNDSFQYVFDYSRMLKEWEEYFESLNDEAEHKYYGLKGVFRFWKDIRNYYEKQATLDQTSIFIFYERAHFMTERLGFIQKDHPAIYAKMMEYGQFLEDFKLLNMLMIKYNTRPEAHLAKIISDKGIEVISREAEILRDIYNILKGGKL